MKASPGMPKMLSIHPLPAPRAGSRVRARHQPGTPTLPCQEGGTERDKEQFCASSPRPGKTGIPHSAQWDGTALPPSRSPLEVEETWRATGTGRGSRMMVVPSALGPCKCFLRWRSTWQSRTMHSPSLAPHPLPAEPPRPGHLRLPPQERSDVPRPPTTTRPPGPCLPSPGSLLLCIWKWFASLCSGRSGLCSLLPAGIKCCRPAVETHCLLARSLAVPAPPTPSRSAPSLPPRYPPAISQLEEGQPQRSHSQLGMLPWRLPAKPRLTPASSCPAISLHPASLRAGRDATHP